MAIAYDPRDRRVYVCRADRSLPREQQTGWILKDLPSKTRTQMEDMVAFQVGGDGFSRGFNSMMRTALKHGLIGVEDDRPLRDRNGDPVPFEKDRGSPKLVTDEFIDRIPRDMQRELALEILGEQEPEDAAVEARAEAVEPSEPSPGIE